MKIFATLILAVSPLLGVPTLITEAPLIAAQGNTGPPPAYTVPSTVQQVAPPTLPNWTPTSSANPLVAKRGQTVIFTVAASVDYTATLLPGCTVDIRLTNTNTQQQHLTGKTDANGIAKLLFTTTKQSPAGAYYYGTAVTCNGQVLTDNASFGYRVLVIQ